MSHLLAFDENNVARAAFTGERGDVWHHEGVYVGDRRFANGLELVDEARANFDVHIVQMMLQTVDGKAYVPAPRGAAIVRDPWPNEKQNEYVQFGMLVGGESGIYQVLQNRDAAALFDPLVDAGLIEYSSCMALENGKRFVMTAKLTDGVVRKNPDGTPDKVEAFLMLYNAHDGHTRVTTNVSSVRTVCNNTLQLALAEGVNVGVKHSGQMEIQLNEARERLAKASDRFAETMKVYKTLAREKATEETVNELFAATFPTYKDEKEVSKRRLNQIAEMTRLMFEGRGNGGGTLWDWFNGVTEYVDHVPASKKATAEETLVSSWFGARATVRERAWDAVSRLVA